jgi:TPP-dependent pyruvate/acetoin dehydrogenase alpha subunit
MTSITEQDLIEFEEEIADLFNSAKIRAPIHLYHSNERQMIEIFKRIDIKKDWVCCTWRNHYQALLKGIPRELLKERILKGKSMIMNLPEYRFICSSIVGGIPSIATGIALAAKLRGSDEKVWCWCGDMSAETGAWHEAYKYSVNHQLPITFVVEDNHHSVLTPTSEVWGRSTPYYIDVSNHDGGIITKDNLIYYQYENRKYPHAGAGMRVQF